MDAHVPEVMQRLKLFFLVTTESECCQDTTRLHSFFIAFFPVLNNTSDLPSFVYSPLEFRDSCGSHSACWSIIWSGQIRDWIWQFLTLLSEDMNGHVLMWSTKIFSGSVGVKKKKKVPPHCNPPPINIFFPLSSLALYLVQFRPFRSSLFRKKV